MCVNFPCNVFSLAELYWFYTKGFPPHVGKLKKPGLCSVMSGQITDFSKNPLTWNQSPQAMLDAQSPCQMLLNSPTPESLQGFKEDKG